MVRRFFLGLNLSFMLLVPSFVSADFASPSYVQILSDIPLADGLSLEEGSDTVFDVPEGKIVEVTTFGPIGLKETEDFYKESLAALGWQQVSENSGKSLVYKRGDELLEISFDDGEDDLQVTFRLTPSTSPLPLKEKSCKN